MLDQESLLFLKPMLLVVLSKMVNHCTRFVFEHPEDPESHPERKQIWLTREEAKTKIPSIWNTRFIRDAREYLGGDLQSFDQGPLGHDVRKSTTIYTDMHIVSAGLS